MNGKTINAITLQQLFSTQLITQDKLIHKGVYDRYKDEHTVTVPVDDVGLASYHQSFWVRCSSLTVSSDFPANPQLYLAKT